MSSSSPCLIRCFCSSSSRRRYLARFHRHLLQPLPPPEPSPATSDSTSSPSSEEMCSDILSVLTETDHLVRTLYSRTSGRRFCRGLFSLCQLLHDHKFLVLSALLRLVSSPSSPRPVCHASSRLFVALLKLLPCSSQSHCERTCQRMLLHLVKTSGVGTRTASGMAPAPAATSLWVLPMLTDVFNDVDLSHSHYQYSDECNVECTDLVSTSVELHSWHDDVLKQTVVGHVKAADWKRMAHRQQQQHNDDANLLASYEFLNLMRKIVSVRSNVGVAACRELIGSTVQLVPEITAPKNCLLWRKQLDLLNEVLCYGSTLALQSDVPHEVSQIAQAIIKESLNSEFLSRTELIPKSHKGFLGDSVWTSVVGEEKQPNQQFMQSFSLLLLKSVALAFREATFCSSGEESDSSHSSRGSLGLVSSNGSDHQEDISIIERNMSRVLTRLHGWMVEGGGYYADTSFSDAVVILFFDQDDSMVEAMLCLLDIYNGFQALLHNLDTSPIQFEPVATFTQFMCKCAWDTSVIIDFLISNETCFLLYFLRLLKYIAKHNPKRRLLDSGAADGPRLKACLVGVQGALEKLTRNQLFPYNVAPILSILTKINGVP